MIVNEEPGNGDHYWLPYEQYDYLLILDKCSVSDQIFIVKEQTNLFIQVFFCYTCFSSIFFKF